MQIDVSIKGAFLTVNDNGKNVIKKSLLSSSDFTSTAIKRIQNNIAKDYAELIQSSITANLKKGMKYTGGAVAKLRPATIKRKGHSRVFLETGKLFKGVIVQKTAGGYVVKMSKARYKGGETVESVSGYLQEGNPNMKARPFFGLKKSDSTKIYNTVIKKYSKQLKDAIKRAAGGGEIKYENIVFGTHKVPKSSTLVKPILRP